MNWKERSVVTKNKALHSVLFGVFGEINKLDLVRLGTSYGGWFTPKDLLEFQGPKSLISAGIGFDVSFDVKMASNGFKVVMVDVDIECCEFAKRNFQNHDGIKVLLRAVSDSDEDVILYSNSQSSVGRWGLDKRKGDFEVERFPAIKLKKLLQESYFSSSKPVVYLKMDIEGSESKIYKDIISCSNEIAFLAIEIDYLSNLEVKRIYEFVKRFFTTLLNFRSLKKSGFILIKHEDSNFYWRNSRFINESGELSLEKA
jgi:FkbM family methyltransferase